MEEGTKRKVIYNLSSRILTDVEERILTKGLKFAPTTTTDDFDRFVDVHKFIRKISLKKFFELKRSEEAPSTSHPVESTTQTLHKKPSTFYPAHIKGNYIETFQKLVIEDLNSINKTEKRKRVRHNLTRKEREPIKSLQEDQGIVIKPCDKGGGIAILNKSDYVKEIYRQLSDSNTYQKLKTDPSARIKTSFQKLLKTHLEKGGITETEFAFLNIEDPITPTIYVLPKIHKNSTSPPGRPIVAGTGCLTSNLSALIDHELQPIVTKNPSHLKDTSDTIKKLEGIMWDSETIMVTADVTSLYTIIEHQRGIEATIWFLDQTGFSEARKSFIIESMDFILKNNLFFFEGDYYLQKRGTAMGTRFAPSFANLFMAHWEHENIYQQNPWKDKILLWNRYIDDVIFFWRGDRESLTLFCEHLNQNDRNIVLTFETSQTEINFLDLTIYIKDAIIQTKTYKKPTDTNNYISKESEHHINWLNGIPKGQFLRIRRNCSEDTVCTSQINELKNAFIEKGYQPENLGTIQIEIMNKGRTSLIHNKKQKKNDDKFCNHSQWSFITGYDHQYKKMELIIRKHWNLLCLDDTLKNIIPKKPTFIYRKAANLKNKLVRSALPQNNNPVRTSGFHRCGLCLPCRLIKTDTSKYTEITVNGINFKIKDFITCHTSNVVYLVECTCGKAQRWLLELAVILVFGASVCLSIFPRFLPCDDHRNASVVICRQRHLKRVPPITSDKVSVLDLSLNHIKHLTNRSFSGLPNLETLNMSNNCQPDNLRPDKERCTLTIQPDALVNLKHLQNLDLSGNSLTTIPPLPENIKYLNLGLNHIFTLTEMALSGVTKLKSLMIGGNCYYLNRCDTEFNISEHVLRNITTLEILLLSFNNISSFPRNLPPSLTNLNLAENKIWKLDREDLCQLPNLRKLDIRWNCQRCDHAAQPCFPCLNDSALQLQAGVFDCLSNLTYLNLRGNSIPTIDSSLFVRLHNLKVLILSDNLLDLKRETFFSKLKNVQILELDYNFQPFRMHERLVINSSAVAMTSLYKISLVGYHVKILDFEGIEPLLRLPNLGVINLRTNFILQANLSMFLLNENLHSISLAENLISFESTCRTERGRTDVTVPLLNRHENAVPGWEEPVNINNKHLKVANVEYPQCYHYQRSVDLSFNNLMSLHSDDFVGMEDVECLNMSYNFINQRLNGSQFGRLKSLRHLDLSYNRFDLYYYAALSELPKLKILNLANNEYQFMMRGVSHRLNFLENLTSLTELNLNNNLIGLRITKELKNPSLEKLFFRKNELVNLWQFGKETYTTMFTNLTRLKVLDISANQLIVIPIPVLEHLPKSLENLSISCNNLYSFHWDNIVHLGNLIHLDLSSNRLTSLNSSIIGIPSKLVYLNLKSNRISSLNKNFFNSYTELKQLFLSDNYIKIIDVRSFPKQLLQTLDVLDVSQNSYECTCRSSWFIQFLMETNVTVEHLSEKMQCDSPDIMRRKSLLSMNPESCQDLYGQACFVCSCLMVTTWMVTAVIWHFFSWDLWYTIKVIKASVTRYAKLSGGTKEEYDAFIAFDTKNNAVTDWVYHELLVQLEGPTRDKFNLCLEERDWLVGKSSIENLYEAIYRSKRTVLILTHEGFNTGLLRHAFLMSHQRLLDEKKDVVVLVTLDDNIKMSRYLLTRKRLCPNSFLNWPRNPRAHAHFWHSLRVLLREDSFHYYDPCLRKQLEH
ncbi:toll-like receptor 7 [Pseudophryne corroboree]|uniref:toll-like receptor 7 n=1 Tax=Pseudophryne corroboree TaxID=495146 RepID=UPI003081C80A